MPAHQGVARRRVSGCDGNHEAPACAPDESGEFEARWFFFCQLETAETLIWLTEAHLAAKVGVEIPSDWENDDEAFRIVPVSLLDKLRQGKVIVRNRHALNWETAEKIAGKRGVDKRGAKSDAACIRDGLGYMANARNILIVNDEAHHV